MKIQAAVNIRKNNVPQERTCDDSVSLVLYVGSVFTSLTVFIMMTLLEDGGRKKSRGL